MTQLLTKNKLLCIHGPQSLSEAHTLCIQLR